MCAVMPLTSRYYNTWDILRRSRLLRYTIIILHNEYQLCDKKIMLSRSIYFGTLSMTYYHTEIVGPWTAYFCLIMRCYEQRESIIILKKNFSLKYMCIRIIYVYL